MSPLRQPRLHLSDDDSNMMDDASVLSSPPRSARTSIESASSCRSRMSIRGTPKSRRLFDDDDTSEDLSHLSPPRSRSTLRPLDLNNELKANDVAASAPYPPLHGRKRTIERRGVQATPRLDNCGESDTSMYLSPMISPNSFLTIDGRFVHSKNPFSSPMMTEDDHQYVNNGASVSVPTIPVSFGANDSKMPCLLPPRHRHMEDKSPGPASLALNSGFPDHRYSFTGSPIQEDMEIEPASSGSLHKVRRFNHSDDVVAASGQHLSARRKNITIDTKVEASVSDEISPTDVLSFPPPTPVKVRPSQMPYTSIRPRAPATPERRRHVPVRTPHPGSFMQEQQDNTPKSRFHSDFDIIGELGKGSFGTVYKVLSRLDGCMYAIKAAQRKAKGVSDRARMLKEVYALAALSDQADTATFHIVRYHQAWMEDDLLYIQTELCQGTLADEISTHVLSEERRYKVLREILLALAFLHRQNMVHLDIKPENIFLKNDQFKLGDFGLVTRASCDQEVEEGDSRYMSMELLSGDRSDLTKSDIFSLGATMYEICLGRSLPMNGQEWQDIRTGRLQYLFDTSDDMAGIIRQMMDPVPSRRPSASELLMHPQLLSDEQKALIRERSKAEQATMQLQQHFQNFAPPKPMKRGLVRANTWNGSSLPYL